MPADTGAGAPLNAGEEKALLKRLKRELKEFEHQFQEEQGRKPSKTDIGGNKEIARKYKQYAKLKSQFESKDGEADETPVEAVAPVLPKAKAAAAPVSPLTPRTPVVQPSLTSLGDRPAVKPAARPAAAPDAATPQTPSQAGWDFLEDLPANFKLASSSAPAAAASESKSQAASHALDEADEDELVQRAVVNDFINRKNELEELERARAVVAPLPENPPVVEERPSSGKQEAARVISINVAAPQNSGVEPAAKKRTKAPVAATPTPEPPQAVQETPTAEDEDDDDDDDEALFNAAAPTAEELRQATEAAAAAARNATAAAPLKPAAEETLAAAQHLVSPSPGTPSAASPTMDTTVAPPSPTPGTGSEPASGDVRRPPPMPAAGAAALAGAAEAFDRNQRARNASERLAGTAAALKVASDMIVDPRLFQRLPRKGILRCRVYRKTSILDKGHPTFFLYNEADEKFLMAARKRVKSKNVNYLISSSHDELTKSSTHYIAKLKANPGRTQFLLYDARAYNEHAPAKGLRELSAVTYSKTVLPREMQAVIAAPNIPEESDLLSKDVLEDMRIRNVQKLLFLRNKPPRWNEATQTHCLNFGGRVTMPSIKNFQLTSEKDESIILMQFGRTGPDLFTLDVRYPLTPVEAFSIALSTFDAYDNS